jgi:beta-phosphoglucomutase-like phosphatase (HAD superfamily)
MNQLRALIFDFDGVIADTEPLHFSGLQKTLREIGIDLTESDYFANYLGYDDRGCFLAALTAHDRPIDPATLTQLMKRKADAYLESVKDHAVIFPGIADLVREAAARYPLAIASGALRHEIEYILEQAGLRKEFSHITSAEDVTRGKPDPQPGIRGAKAAGMKVLAVANTHTLQDLHEADAAAPNLDQVHLSDLLARLWPRQ